MYVYIWKDRHGIPFYVGFTQNKRRTNPRNSGGRNWLCKQKLKEIGVDRVIIELRPVASIEEGVALECSLILEYGRVQTENGPLTNLTSGGEGAHSPSPEHKEKLRQRMLDPAHPIRGEKARAKKQARLKDPDVIAAFSGDNNPAKRPEVREKIKAKWQDPEFRAARIAERTGVKKHSDQFKDAARKRLLDPTNPMREYHKTLNSDPTIAAKRATTLRSPEQRKRQSDAMKAYWATRKSS